jgi:DNA-binding NtrC family response regulator
MPGNILIIDDEDQLRKLMSRIISLESFVVVVVNLFFVINIKK